MNERPLSATDLVALPQLRSVELLALCGMLLAAANAEASLPAHVRQALDDVDAQRVPLTEALGATPKRPTVSLKAADRAEDNAVGALVDFCASWVRLPEEKFPESVRVARECLAVLRSDDRLDYLTLRPVVEHSEVQRRLDALHARKLDVALRKLGAGAFLDHLAQTHEVYGVVTGATAPLEVDDTPAVRDAATELAETLRVYVVRVVGLIDRKRPETGERVQRLLKPLSTWSRRSTAANDDRDEVPVDHHPASDPQPPAKTGTDPR